ncbi:uncharacterized protein MKZ38_005217 [Zalerion maritima]|uniref:F-box domain-containing protein n=1 Tax=Zalerion maritima TaxID=339359 RepID=A0AAD5WQI2_9PEZI|nr:uncharacterized protein MKZ38_005217 [Zalerion maritima]
MDKLPLELVEHILETFAKDHHRQKNKIFPLRRVCRTFDKILAPILLKTLQLDFIRLDRAWSRSNGGFHIAPHALVPRGSLAQALYVDTMVVRDTDELDYMDQLFRDVEPMQVYIPMLRRQYCMNESTFTPAEFRQKLGQILLYTPNVERFRLNLPFQLVGRYCDASTMILSNALAALAENLSRAEKEPELKIADLKVLVLESVADASMLKLWNNPIDVRNIAAVFHKLEHIVFGIRRQDFQADYVPDADVILGQRIWTMLGMSGKMRSICISTLDNDDIPKSRFKETLFVNPFQALRVRSKALPFFKQESTEFGRRPASLNRLNFRFLRSLEFRRVELDGPKWMQAMESFPALEELFLCDVYLQTFHDRTEPSKVMWIGLPNERPPKDHCWVAQRLRRREPRLKVIKAHHIAYHRISTDTTPLDEPIYDLADPCGLARELPQRFVEVAMGYKQPNIPHRATPTDLDLLFPDDIHPYALSLEADDEQIENASTSYGLPIPQTLDYLGPSSAEDHLVVADIERPENMRREDTCALNYQLTSRNPTSGWSRSIDGWFPNCNSHTLRELHKMTDKACYAMRQLNIIDSQRIQEMRQDAQTQTGTQAGTDTQTQTQAGQTQDGSQTQDSGPTQADSSSGTQTQNSSTG